jgi:hypothetical protein
MERKVGRRPVLGRQSLSKLRNAEDAGIFDRPRLQHIQARSDPVNHVSLRVPHPTIIRMKLNLQALMALAHESVQ